MTDLGVTALSTAPPAPVDRYARCSGVAAGTPAACRLSALDHGKGVVPC
ncbi:hypothetical protein [Streptomyces puniciscabiei]